MAETVSEAVINQLAAFIGTTCDEKGFWEIPNPQLAQLNTKLLLIISEVIEAQEILRQGPHPDDDSPDFLGDVMTLQMADQFLEELADIVIRVLDVPGHFGWNIGEIILAKVQKNKDRPFRHGKRF